MRDNVFSQYLLQNVVHKEVILEQYHTEIFNSKEVVYVEKGLLIHTDPKNKKYQFQLYKEAEFIFLEDDYIDSGIEVISKDAIIKILDKKEFILFLEKEKLLDAFLYSQLMVLQSKINNLGLITGLPIKEMFLVILHVFAQYSLLNEEEVVCLPKWVNMKNLAKITNHSRFITSQYLRELERENFITIDHSGWTVNIQKIAIFFNFKTI